LFGSLLVVAVPRLSLKRRALFLGTVLFGLSLIIPMVLIHGVFGPRFLEDAKVVRAKADVVALTKAVGEFHRLTGVYPDSLEALTHPREGKTLVEAEALLSPWGWPYQYDLSGPRNQGNRPDIWIQAPDGEVLGNWVTEK
jgi:hypothetical protein